MIVWNAPLPLWRRVVEWRSWRWLDGVAEWREAGGWRDALTNVSPGVLIVPILAVMVAGNWFVGGPWMATCFAVLWVRFRVVALVVNWLLLCWWLS
jgi:hypothetical protein